MVVRNERAFSQSARSTDRRRWHGRHHRVARWWRGARVGHRRVSCRLSRYVTRIRQKAALGITRSGKPGNGSGVSTLFSEIKFNSNPLPTLLLLLPQFASFSIGFAVLRFYSSLFHSSFLRLSVRPSVRPLVRSFVRSSARPFDPPF